MPSLQTFLDFAADAAAHAGRLTLAHYQTGVAVERKADRSIVTRADREAEQLLRREIARAFPDHAVVGEEFGSDDRDASHRWILDPIDGTTSFARGVPLYGVLVALEIRGEVVVGVAHFPALGETYTAAHGLGARWNGRPMRVSATAGLDEACLAYTDVVMLEDRMRGAWPRLLRRVTLVRGWGDCYGHCLVASGRADIMLDPRMSPWDCAALLPIVQEAGGRFTDWQGRAGIDGGDAVSTNGRIHEHILEFLAPVPDVGS